MIRNACLVAAFLLSSTTLSMAQELPSASKPNVVPYTLVDYKSEEVGKIWHDPGTSDEWWDGEDDSRSAMIARFKNDLDQDVVISQWKDRMSCSPMECPVRVFVADEMVFNDLACSVYDEHTLSEARNSLFLCDVVVPLRAGENEE